jgi:hypothetical protein
LLFVTGSYGQFKRRVATQDQYRADRILIARLEHELNAVYTGPPVGEWMQIDMRAALIPRETAEERARRQYREESDKSRERWEKMIRHEGYALCGRE